MSSSRMTTYIVIAMLLGIAVGGLLLRALQRIALAAVEFDRAVRREDVVPVVPAVAGGRADLRAGDRVSVGEAPVVEALDLDVVPLEADAGEVRRPRAGLDRGGLADGGVSGHGEYSCYCGEGNCGDDADECFLHAYGNRVPRRFVPAIR